MNEIIIGSHVSFTKNKQLLGSVEEALSYGANAFMFYTGAPQNTARSEISESLTEEGHKLMSENGISEENVIVHAPYIINPANSINLDFAISFLKNEIKRVSQLGFYKLVIHPGSHVNQGIDKGIENIITVLNACIDPNIKVDIYLETMAGKGSEIGSSFEEIKRIIDGIIYKDKVKVCLDTCHINDAGYDLNKFDNLLDEFDKVIGLSKLCAIHVNDSKGSLSSHKDRHENFGLGNIGFENMIKIIYHPKLKGIPKILETPYVTFDDNSKERLYPPYKFEIETIRSKKQNLNLLEDIRNFYK